MCAYTHIYMQTFQHLWITDRFLRSQLRYDQLKNILTGLVAANNHFPFFFSFFFFLKSIVIVKVFSWWPGLKNVQSYLLPFASD